MVNGLTRRKVRALRWPGSGGMQGIQVGGLRLGFSFFSGEGHFAAVATPFDFSVLRFRGFRFRDVHRHGMVFSYATLPQQLCISPFVSEMQSDPGARPRFGSETEVATPP